MAPGVHSRAANCKQLNPKNEEMPGLVMHVNRVIWRHYLNMIYIRGPSSLPKASRQTAD
jgi:hypothetical protein